MNTSPLWTEERLLIDGELVQASDGGTYPNLSPTSETAIGVAAAATAADVDRSITAARRAFDETDWATNHGFRARCLRQLHAAMRSHEAELGEILVAEVGAPRMLLGGPHCGLPIDLLTYYADHLDWFDWIQDKGVAATMGGPAHRWVEHRASGVVAAITPWNYPLQISLAKLAPALAAGCTMILKAAPDTPWTALALGKLIAEHTDIPAGVVNTISSPVNDIGELLTTDPRVDLVSFTGSTGVGRRIMEAGAPTIKRVFLELGGKSASLVLDDVEDIGAAVANACFQVCTHAGQGCATTSRLLLPRHLYDAGVEAAAAILASMPYGDPDDPAVLQGPLINSRQRDQVERYVTNAVADGARIVTGGQRPPHLDTGYFYEPTLLADVDNSMAVAREEIFGPVLVAIPYDGDDDAIRIANDSIFGLSGAVIGRDRQRATDVGRRIRSGTMSINGGVWYSPDMPFGGFKQSGVGREMGEAGFEEYLETMSFAQPADS